MKTIHVGISILFLSFISCSGCLPQPPDESPDSLLDKEYTFIVGLLTADTIRDYCHEVFVGKIKPQHKDEHVDAGEDPWCYLVTRTMHSFYNAYVVASKGDARVVIYRPEGDSVVMAHAGNGFYRDMDDALDVKPNATYHLRVYWDDEFYTGKTTTPGPFKTLINTDTVTVPLKQIPGVPVIDLQGKIALPLTKSQGAFFYRDYIYGIQYKSGIEKGRYDVLDHFFGQNDGLIYQYYDSTCVSQNSIICVELLKHDVTAIDSNYGLIYRAGDTFTGSNDWTAWFESINDLPAKKLSERSTITGKSVGGVFGSYYNIRFEFWVKSVIQNTSSIKQHASKEVTNRR